MDKIKVCYLISILKKFLVDTYQICPFQTTLLSVSNEAGFIEWTNQGMLYDKRMERITY
ncbi:MAG TPA: hypothetical protein PK481_10220 [Bacillota bacterium]|nr:hypothetical protein [Bacillota bacterium]